LIKAGGKTIRYETNKLIISIWSKEELPEDWKESIVVTVYKKGDNTDCNNYRGISLLRTTYRILSNNLLSRFPPYAEEIIGDHQCGFRRNTTGQLQITYSAFVKYLRKHGNTTKHCISSSWTSRKIMIQLRGRSCIIFSKSLISPSK